MDANSAELTEVLEHDSSGRILRFVKTLVPLATAESLKRSLKAKAVLQAEEMKAQALVRDTEALVEKAHAPASVKTPAAPAARPVPQQRAAPRASVPAPVASADHDEVVPVRDVTVPASLLAKRKQQEAQLAALRKENEALRAQAKAAIAEQVTKIGTVKGWEVGRAVMLDVLDRTPPGSKATNVDKAMESPIRSALKQYNEKYPLMTQWPEFPAAFEKGFWLGANDAVAEHNNKQSAHPAP